MIDTLPVEGVGAHARTDCYEASGEVGCGVVSEVAGGKEHLLRLLIERYLCIGSHNS